ncbi:hypothetical protein ACQKLP_05535 [Chitinophaga sp. NPDC101104]|uniref:hypothetical protein n=1 Tax=Chitinophaga sp. NPDC101104 TaxID=3390561 RepID=UPI003CFE9B3F
MSIHPLKLLAILYAFLMGCQYASAQNRPKLTAPQVPCNGTADAVAGIYTDHTQTKYPLTIKGTAAEKAMIMKNMIAIEKLEESSRSGFKLTGCAARVSFARFGTSEYGKIKAVRYGYQLGVYKYACHVTEHVPKIVDEYRTVFRVDINPYIFKGAKAGGTGDFSVTGNLSYEIPIEARNGPDFDQESKNRPSKVSQYITEATMLTNRSNDYRNKHAEFLKIINGEGYTENWMSGDRYDQRRPDSYKWIDRHYMITRPGVPLLVPVSRKQYLEDMLEYLEIEKFNFDYSHAAKLKDIANENADWAKKQRAVLEADKLAYPNIYEAKKAKLQALLATQKADWLQKPAVVDNNNKTYNAGKRLESLGKFYDAEDEYMSALYILNPAYFNSGNAPLTKPIFMEVQFRYELGNDVGFSTRIFQNFLENFDMAALRKMLE